MKSALRGRARALLRGKRGRVVVVGAAACVAATSAAALLAWRADEHYGRSSAPADDEPRAFGGIIPVAHAYSVATDQIINNRHNKRPASDADWQPSYDTDFRNPRTRLSDHPGENSFDVLVIGGGKLGASIALDAVSRGLRVCLVEREDFGCGATTARGEQLLRGYGLHALSGPLALARNWSTLSHVLDERIRLWRTAPHLLRQQIFFAPAYNIAQRAHKQPAFLLADALADLEHDILDPSWMNKQNAVVRFPHIIDPYNMYGGFTWQDAGVDLARLATSIALTALGNGATVCNHANVTQILREDGKVSGALVRDELSGRDYSVKARVVVNATGASVDDLRRMDDDSCRPIVANVQQQLFITLPESFGLERFAQINDRGTRAHPVCIAPWLFRTVALVSRPALGQGHPGDDAGTSSLSPALLSRPTEQQVSSMMRDISLNYILPVHRMDVLSAWLGMSFSLRREHLRRTLPSRDCTIELSPSNLITAVKSDWSTVRRAAAEVIDAADGQGLFDTDVSNTSTGAPAGGRDVPPSAVDQLMLYGANNFYHKIYTVTHRGLGVSSATSVNLKMSYGDRAEDIARIMFDDPLLSRRLGRNLPTTEAEIIYICRNECVQTAADVVARRTRMMFLDREESLAAVPRVVRLMSRVFAWDAARQQREIDDTIAYIKQNTS